MKQILIIFSFVFVLIISIIFSVRLWFHMDFIDLSFHGVLAIIIAVIVSLILGFGLMSLSFFSSRFGFDDRVDHDLESIFEKHKKL